jgi:hypothetical protein
VHSSKPSNSKHNKTSSSTALQQTRRQAVEDLHQILRCRRRRIQASTDRKISGGVIPCPAAPLVFHSCKRAASSQIRTVAPRSGVRAQSPALLTMRPAMPPMRPTKRTWSAASLNLVYNLLPPFPSQSCPEVGLGTCI